MEGMRVTLVEDIDDLSAFFSWLGECREWLAVDVETDGLRWWDGTLRLVQFGDEQQAFALPWEWWPKAIMDVLKKYKGRLVGHNVPFDVHWLERFAKLEPEWHRIHDTMTMVHLIEPYHRSGLKEAGKRHIHPHAGDGERKLKALFVKEKWDWPSVPIDHPLYWGYGCIDTILTARLAAKLYPKVQAERREVYDMERQIQAILYRMEKKGATIDRDYVSATAQRFQNRVDQLLTWGSTQHQVALGSNQQVITWLMNQGVELTKTTEKGALALDDEVLLTVMRDYPGRLHDFMKAVRSCRKLRKLTSTYLLKFLELSDDSGHLHPSIRRLGARTGRMSVATPSLQNLPRNAEVRSSFVASPGNRLVLADFDQIEIRLLAHFCQDPGLIAAIYDESIDVHTSAARQIYRDPNMSKADPRRMTTKNAVFAKVYGAGPAKFALTAGITEDAAVQFMHDYDSTFPNVNQFIGWVQAVARERMRSEGETYVTTPMGRLESLGPAAGNEYKLVNYLIQGTAADVMKHQLCALDAAGLGEYMILPVHDEIIMDVPEEDVADVSETVKREMPVPAGRYTVPLTNDLTVVQSWGEKYQGANTWIDDAFEDIFAAEMSDL